MVRKPRFEALPIEVAAGDIEHQSFLFVCFCNDLEAVQDEKAFLRGVRDPLVAIQKRMIEGGL